MEKMKEIFKPVLYSSGRKCRTCPMPNIDVNNKKKRNNVCLSLSFLKQ